MYIKPINHNRLKTANLRWLVIINPVAGKGKGKKVWPHIAEQLAANKINFEFVFSEYKQHIKEIIKEKVSQGNFNFLICGGDGSLSEAVNAVMNLTDVARENTVLGVIPIGSGNDWCRTHKISDNYRKAVDQFANGTILQHDVGFAQLEQANHKHYFVNIAGAGYEGYVVEKINEQYPINKPGKMIYKLMLLKCLLGYKASEAYIQAENCTVNEKIFSMSISICKYNGGGMMQAPQASYNDGLLTVNIIKNLSLLQVIKNLQGLKDGSYIKHKQVISFDTKELILRGEKQPIEADGESLGMGNAVFGIIPLAIKMVLP